MNTFTPIQLFAIALAIVWLVIGWGIIIRRIILLYINRRRFSEEINDTLPSPNNKSCQNNSDSKEDKYQAVRMIESVIKQDFNENTSKKKRFFHSSIIKNKLLGNKRGKCRK